MTNPTNTPDSGVEAQLEDIRVTPEAAKALLEWAYEDNSTISEGILLRAETPDAKPKSNPTDTPDELMAILLALEADEHNETYEQGGFYPRTVTVESAHAAITELILDVIGEDESEESNGLLPDRNDRRNQLRAEQRNRLGKS